MDRNIDINETDILTNNPEVLEKLLQDHNTGKNIFWATESYSNLGEGYQFDDEITIDHITGENGRTIQPRVVKEAAIQSQRSKDMAEVFTPSWICNIQNNLIDEAWFGRKDVFNIENHELSTWTPIEDKIEFSEVKSWKDYVRDLRLEITCGEGPYLASRYDAVTGEPIMDLSRRIGILDRKLRIVSENTETSGEWIEWAKEALKSTYGFEWQGDNLLLARETLFYTVCDFFEDKFKRSIPRVSLAGIAEIISWNIWQMDGLKFVVPTSCDKTSYSGLFGDLDKEECPGCKTGDPYSHIGIKCRIKDWKYTGKDPEKKTPLFVTLLKNK